MRRKRRCLVAQRSNAIWVFLVRFEDSSLISAAVDPERQMDHGSSDGEREKLASTILGRD